MNDSVKQRLIGAVVLLLISASIWPIIFRPAERKDVVVESLIPPPPPLEMFEIPEQEDPKPIPSVIQVLENQRPEFDPEAIDDLNKKDIEQLELLVAEKEALPDTQQLEQDITENLAKPATLWAIQLGAFSQSKNAENLADSMRNKGYSVVVQSRFYKGQTLAFVYLGPYTLKTQAEKINAQLNSAKTSTRIVNFKL